MSDVSLDDLARQAVRIPLDAIPLTTRTHAIWVVADTIGVIFGGGRLPEIERLVRGQDPLFPPPAGGLAQLLIAGLPGADPSFAAFINATAGTFLELDEGYRPTGHPAMHVLPAALATAQALHRSGADFLLAVLSGYEVTARLFEAYRLTYPLHPHGHFGAVGAAVAVARLREVDPAEPAAIAATLPLLPVWQPCLEGATARNAYTGVASALGLVANRMALVGFRGSREAQPAAFGGLVGELVNPAALTAAVDPCDLRIGRNYLKFHSACALNHAALDAVLLLRPEADQVERVEVETIANNLKIAVQARPNDLSTRFSLPYAVATAIIHGHTRPEAFVPDERVVALARRVEVRAAPDLDAMWPEAAPARVTVHAHGQRSCLQVNNPRGHHRNPPTEAELRGKFELLVARPEAAELYDRLLGLAEVDDMARIFDLLA